MSRHALMKMLSRMLFRLLWTLLHDIPGGSVWAFGRGVDDLILVILQFSASISIKLLQAPRPNSQTFTSDARSKRQATHC